MIIQQMIIQNPHKVIDILDIKTYDIARLFQSVRFAPVIKADAYDDF